jgi:hypothetical protein
MSRASFAFFENRLQSLAAVARFRKPCAGFAGFLRGAFPLATIAICSSKTEMSCRPGLRPG